MKEDELDKFRGEDTQLSEDSGRDSPANTGVLGTEGSVKAPALGREGDDGAGDGVWAFASIFGLSIFRRSGCSERSAESSSDSVSMKHVVPCIELLGDFASAV